MEKKERSIKSTKNFLFVYFAVLIIVLTVIGILEHMGYVLIRSGIQYLLFGLLLCSALGVCGLWLIRRSRRKWFQLLVGFADGLLVFALAVLLVMLFKLNSVVSAGYYATLTAPDGGAAVIMRRISTDEDRIRARRQARGAIDVLEGDESFGIEDLGYIYMAYPRWAGLFYNQNAAGEGSVEIGCASSALLMHRWTDGHCLYMYVESPEAGDGGELTLTLD